MPVNLLGLIQGAHSVLPVGFDQKKQSELYLANLNIINMEGTRSRQFNGFVLSSVKTDVYSTRIWFTGLNRPVAEQVPSLATNTCLVRCSCPAYYFYFVMSNANVGGQIGGNRFIPYVRKTPPPPEGRPYKNVSNLPGMCKHLIFLMNTLKARELIR